MEVCRQSGVRVKLVQYGSYVFTGLASGLVAFFFLIRSGAANIGTASNLEFNALQALMLGGVLITGGSSVKFRSAVIGSITMAALANGMTMWGVETLTQQLIKGFNTAFSNKQTPDAQNVRKVPGVTAFGRARRLALRGDLCYPARGVI